MVINFVPEVYVDVSKYWEAKAKMLACHVSQQGYMLDQYDVTRREFVRAYSMCRELQTGCAMQKLSERLSSFQKEREVRGYYKVKEYVY